MSMKLDKRIENHQATTYKTAHYDKWQVAHLQQSANKQNKRIARWYWKHPNHLMSPSHLHKILFPNAPNEEGWPLSSTKRAITTLTKKQILIKTEQTCKSTRGGTEHKWRWRRPEEVEKDEEPEQDPQPIQGVQQDAFGAPEVKHQGAYSGVN